MAQGAGDQGRDNAVDKYLDRGRMLPGGNTVNFTVYAKRGVRGQLSRLAEQRTLKDG
ncbi:MAG: hypothetical protein U0694_12890 [Anaerolineae bacterium]